MSSSQLSDTLSCINLISQFLFSSSVFFTSPGTGSQGDENVPSLPSLHPPHCTCWVSMTAKGEGLFPSLQLVMCWVPFLGRAGTFTGLLQETEKQHGYLETETFLLDGMGNYSTAKSTQSQYEDFNVLTYVNELLPSILYH